MLNNILRDTLIAGVFALLFLPLIVAGNMFFPFITGKNFFFRVVTEILFGVWIVLAVRDSAYRPRRSHIVVALTGFIAIITLSAIFGENFYQSFWSNYERMEGLVTHLHLFAYFFVVSSVLTTEKLWMRFFQMSLGVSVIVGIYALGQMSGGIPIHQGSTRVDATFGNAAYLAIYTLFHIFLATFLFLRNRGIHYLYLYGSIVLLNLVVLYQTATRGTILGLFAGMLLSAILIALFEREQKVLRKISAGVVIGIMVVVAAFITARDTSFVQESPVLERFASISLVEQTTKSRFQIWGMALQGAREHPILGWGQENFDIIFSKYYNPSLYDQEPFFDRAHNVFLDWLTAGGVLGLLAYLALFFATVLMIWRASNNFSIAEKSVLTGLLAGYFVHNLFVFDNVISYISFFSLIAFIHVSGIREDVNEKSYVRRVTIGEIGQYVTISCVSILVVLSMYVINIKPILANRALLSALQPHQQEGLTKNLDEFRRALSYNTFGSSEVREQFAQAAVRVAGAKQIPQDIKQTFFEESLSGILKQIEEDPNDARSEIFAGSFLSSFAMYDEAISHLDRARELSPGKQDIQLALVSAYINKGDYETAFTIAKNAYELEETNSRARDVYALAAVYAQQFDVADEILVAAYGTALVPTDNFINAYAKIGRFDVVVDLWKQRIAEAQVNGEDNYEYHVSLAAAYFGNGQKIESIEEIQRAIEINPEFKSQGDIWIEDLRAGKTP